MCVGVWLNDNRLAGLASETVTEAANRWPWKGCRRRAAISLGSRRGLSVPLLSAGGGALFFSLAHLSPAEPGVISYPGKMLPVRLAANGCRGNAGV